jgi:hypothetical protein
MMKPKAYVGKTRCPDETPGGTLQCRLMSNHGEIHEDPKTGTKWAHPKIPYGMRKPPKRGGE